jgi:hypothetical protein
MHPMILDLSLLFGSKSKIMNRRERHCIEGQLKRRSVSNDAGTGLVRDPQFQRPSLQPASHLSRPLLAADDAGRRIV